MRATKKQVSKMMRKHGTNSVPNTGDIVDFILPGNPYPCNWGCDEILANFALIERAEKNAKNWGWVSRHNVML